MAFYDEHGGDSQFGRYNKNFEGPVGPRRPSMYYVISSHLAICLM